MVREILETTEVSATLFSSASTAMLNTPSRLSLGVTNYAECQIKNISLFQHRYHSIGAEGLQQNANMFVI
jgi:hypothetical protein